MHKDTDYTYPPARRIGALALIRDESGAVLLVKPTYREGWQLPGGCADADEKPHIACAREVSEETGLEFTPGRLLVVDYIPRNTKTGAAEGYNFIHSGGVVPHGTKITLPAAKPGKDPELSEYRFVPLSALPTLTAPYQERRVRAAVAVLEDGRAPAYLVEGKAEIDAA